MLKQVKWSPNIFIWIISQEDLARLTEIEQSMAVFCMATYGEGDPTDNAQQFHDFLQAGNADLTGLRYAVSIFACYININNAGIWPWQQNVRAL